MDLTKWTHSCVTLEKDGGKLVLDPGAFSEASAALADATAVLVTHEHPDHLDVDAVRTALAADDELQLCAPAAVAEQFAEFGDRVRAVTGGSAFDVGGFSVRTFGDQHAVIHPRIPVIANVGYLVDDSVFHPGDSFTVPEVPVRVLLVPATAPWARVADAVDFAISVRAPRALPIHEAVYSEVGRDIANRLVEGFVSGFGSEYAPVPVGSSITV